MSENGEIYTAGKNFTLPPALTAWTNSTSGLIAELILQLTPIDSGNTLGDEGRILSFNMMVKCGGVAFPETWSKSVKCI